MYHLSAFAYIFVVLIILSFVLVCKNKYHTRDELITSAIVALVLVAGTCTLICDYACGKETVVTSVRLDSRLGARKKYYMYFSDEQGSRYWGMGDVSPVHLHNTIQTVRITYLPKTRYVISIDKYVGDIPQISIQGIKNDYREYRQIYSNEASWVIACIIAGVFMLIYTSDKNGWFRSN